ncbi:hypothetical protein B0H13DRAFT_1920547 [Mycena leptocephala]|nr:hypothetical protein B0H13DRAFT_1920547 [Mycena leptocephala]
MATTALTPVVDHRRNQDLRNHPSLLPFFEEHTTKRQSRNQVIAWARRLRVELFKDNFKPLLFAWATASTALDIPEFAFPTVVDAFVEVQQFLVADNTTAAVTRLAQLQRSLLEFSQYGIAQVPTKQRNLPGEWQTVDWESDLSSADEESESESECESDPEAALPNEPAPLKKRRVDPVSEFWQLDALPIKGRDESQWNRLLRQSPGIWPEKVGWWKETMESVLVSEIAFGPSEPGLVMRSSILYDSMVLVLREIRHVRISIYKQAAWRLQVQDLLRKNRIQDSIRLILRRWTPPAVVQSWVLKAVVFVGLPSSGVLIADGNSLIAALLTNRSLIPRVSYPQAVYFALGLDTFVRTWHLFLGAGLHSFGYNVHSCNLPKLYGNLMQVLKEHQKRKRLNESRIPDVGLLTIFVRTMKFKALKRELENYAFQHKPVNVRGIPLPKPTMDTERSAGRNHDACSWCQDLPLQEQCVEYVLVRHEPVDESLRGCAITFADKEHQRPLVTPKKSKKRKDGSYHTPRPPPGILNALDPKLNLRFIEADPARIERCGRHLVWIIDQDTDEKIDFVLFEAFSEEHLKLMLEYHALLTKVQPVVRGQQFNYYTHGKMYPHGAHAGSGGADGDALRLYEGISANTLQDLNCMFNYAEELLILIETTRSIFPELARDMTESTAMADRLGLTGCHLYKCHNFTSPIHPDRDKSIKSICAQLFLQAKKWEFAFVRMEYRLCVRSQSNTLWSFDGAKHHCCFQPSTEPLTQDECQEEPYRAYRIRGGADVGDISRSSVGSHGSAPARSMEMAEQYEDARQTSEELDDYWDGNVN